MKKLLHWIACHNVILVLLVFLVIAIVLREPLFGIKIPAPDHSSSETEFAAQKLPVSAVQPDPEPATEPVPKAVSKPDIAPNIGPDTAPDPQPFPESSETEVTEPVADSAAEEIIKAETAEEIQQREKYDFRPPEELPVDDMAEESLLQKARKAYWNDQLDSAYDLYLAHIEQNPDNPDGYGELGNLLSTLGELDKAAEMYEHAAGLLELQGKTEQAQQLHEVLDSIRVIQATN